MAVLDEDFGTDLTPAEGGDSLWSLPMVAPTCEPLDWQSLFEQAQARVDEERVRADVAELRRAERDACSRARSLERQLDTCRYKLKVAVDEAKELRRAVPSTPKKESRTAKVLERRIKSQDGEIADLRVSLHRSHEHRERIEAQHQDEINWLKKDIDRGRSQLVEASRSRNRALDRWASRLSGGQAACGGPGGNDRVAARTQRPAAGGGRAGHGTDRVAA